jgi:hypothetical protein
MKQTLTNIPAHVRPPKTMKLMSTLLTTPLLAPKAALPLLAAHPPRHRDRRTGNRSGFAPT